MPQRIKTSYTSYFNSLQIPLKDSSKVFVSIFRAIAQVFEDLSSYAEEVLFYHFIQSEKDSEMYSRDRGVTRIKNESLHTFQSRLINAYTFNRNSSTLRGLTDILRSFTEKEFVVRELYREDFVLGKAEEKLGITTQLQSSLASYYFVVDFSNPLTVEEKKLLTEILDQYKPVHIGFQINARIADDWKLGDIEEKLGVNTYLEK